MTVKKLIKILQELDPKSEVISLGIGKSISEDDIKAHDIFGYWDKKLDKYVRCPCVSIL